MSGAANMPGSVVLFSNGIAITSDDLDFGDLSSKVEINRMSSFSQMVNDIPNSTLPIWTPTGIKTWDVYDMILTQSTFGTAGKKSPEPVVSSAPLTQSAKVIPTEDSTESLTVIPQLEAISSALKANGFLLPTPLAIPSIPASGVEVAPISSLNQSKKKSNVPRVSKEVSQVVKAESFGAAPVASPGVASLFLQLKSQLAIDVKLDTQGNTFYSTPIFPSDFSAAVQSGDWRPFAVSPQPGDLWLPVPNGGKITGEMLTVVLQRPWWSPSVFTNTAWQFDPTSGLTVVSSGAVPSSGLMPMFCSALLIAKNVQTIPGPGPSPPVISAPFTLSQQPTGTAPSLNSGSAPPGGLMIFGFVCNFVPKCPNPNPALRFDP